MSFIHEALKKAQKEKDSLYRKYHGIASRPGYKPRFLSGKALWLTSFLLISLAFAAYLWLPSKRIQPRIHEPAMPEATQQSPPHPALSATGETVRPALPALARQKLDNAQGRKTRSGPGARQKLDNAQGRKTRSGPGVRGASHKLLSKHPEGVASASALYEKARLFQKSGRLQEAKRVYEETLSLDPDYVDALNNLGVIHIYDKNYSAARALFAKAIRLKSDYVDSYYNLACLHALNGEVSQSLVHLKKAVSLNQSVKDWARRDTDLQNLRLVPEFEEIIRKNGGIE
jgi:tetratricopeptide (TPR) repeat protein